MLEEQLNIVSAQAIVLAAIVSIYLTIRLKGDLRKLSAILSIFILSHSFYHIFEFVGNDLLADRIFEPLSVLILILFGVVYSNIDRPKKQRANNISLGAWIPGGLPFIMDNITPMLLVIALGIFIRLAIISKSIKTFQFQISVFIIIWILGEIAGILRDIGILRLTSVQSEIGLEIHVISMVFFSLMLWFRFYYSMKVEKLY
ncbi:MAG TPA: hypothetical protein VH796_14535 [Nitrososphaeraceae archaeon]|jgi:hypothetical protein